MLKEKVILEKEVINNEGLKKIQIRLEEKYNNNKLIIQGCINNKTMYYTLEKSDLYNNQSSKRFTFINALVDALSYLGYDYFYKIEYLNEVYKTLQLLDPNGILLSVGTNKNNVYFLFSNNYEALSKDLDYYQSQFNSKDIDYGRLSIGILSINDILLYEKYNKDYDILSSNEVQIPIYLLNDIINSIVKRKELNNDFSKINEQTLYKDINRFNKEYKEIKLINGKIKSIYKCYEENNSSECVYINNTPLNNIIIIDRHYVLADEIVDSLIYLDYIKFIKTNNFYLLFHPHIDYISFDNIFFIISKIYFLDRRLSYEKLVEAIDEKWREKHNVSLSLLTRKKQ